LSRAVHSPRVLIVDDSEPQASVLATLLDDDGFECAVSTDPEQAIATQGSFAANVVVLDVVMSRLDGITLLAKLREQQPDLPAILTTGLARSDPRVEVALRWTNVRYVGKPIDLKVLHACLADLLGDSRGA
jgi:DNA-binding response OmpR family regulator